MQVDISFDRGAVTTLVFVPLVVIAGCRRQHPETRFARTCRIAGVSRHLVFGGAKRLEVLRLWRPLPVAVAEQSDAPRREHCPRPRECVCQRTDGLARPMQTTAS